VDERVKTVFCGSLPPGVSPDVFTDLLTHCREQGARVVCDTSGEALHAAIESGSVHTVKPNLSELSQCLGEEVGPETAPHDARALLGHVKVVLLTLGRRGAHVIEAGTELGMCCPLSAKEVNNTVGCGDAFLAGWLDALENGADLASALKQAVSAGAAAACGATAVDYTRCCVDARMDQCQEIDIDGDDNAE
jgi:fructose-1-phosphate kinase PfkB-like protein